MSIYYPASTCSGDAVPAYNCNPCPNYEYGRIRSLAFIKTSYVATVLVDPSNSSVWSTGVNSGDIVVVYECSGSYDGGTTTELTGFGDSATFNGNTTHIATVNDPNYLENCDFYNAIRNSKEYTIAYRTSSAIHIAESPVTISPKNPVADDINSVVIWNLSLKWTNPDSPCPYTTPTGVFDQCYINA